MVTKKHKATDPSSMDSTSEGNNAWCALQNTHINNIASAIAQLDAEEDKMSASTTSSYRRRVPFTTTAEKTDFTFGSPPKNNTSTAKSPAIITKGLQSNRDALNLSPLLKRLPLQLSQRLPLLQHVTINCL